MALKRAALGYYRGSNGMAKKFFGEALKRRDEIDSSTVKPYVAKLLKNIEKIKDAEDALLYSTIFQNASRR